ncbi:MAG: class I SAM-dependent methyltransferase [Saccharofermentanales bacterium]
MSGEKNTFSLILPSANGDIEMTIETRHGIFSPHKADEGTLAMLSTVALKPGETLLDLGCGCGMVAIWAARQIGGENVSMLDVDPEAVEVSKINAQNNGFGNIQAFCSDGFANYTITELDWILSNPPYHADFRVPKLFIEKGFNRLKTGGRMVMVTKRELWYKNKFITVFGGVQIKRIGEYFVFTAQKRSATRGGTDRGR